MQVKEKSGMIFACCAIFPVYQFAFISLIFFFCVMKRKNSKIRLSNTSYLSHKAVLLNNVGLTFRI